MPDLHCPDCGKERFERHLTMKIKDGKTYYELTNPKTGAPGFKRMGRFGRSY